MTEAEARELSERTWDAVRRRDLDAFLPLVHPDFEGTSALVESEGGAGFTGVDGARAWIDNLNETYETVDLTLEQLLVVGPHFVSVNRARWVGKGSGVELSQPVYFVNEARDGRWVFLHSHLEPAPAFAEFAERLAQGASSPSQ